MLPGKLYMVLDWTTFQMRSIADVSGHAREPSYLSALTVNYSLNSMHPVVSPSDISQAC
jgi:hypothetical protein